MISLLPSLIPRLPGNEARYFLLEDCFWMPLILWYSLPLPYAAMQSIFPSQTNMLSMVALSTLSPLALWTRKLLVTVRAMSSLTPGVNYSHNLSVALPCLASWPRARSSTRNHSLPSRTTSPPAEFCSCHLLISLFPHFLTSHFLISRSWF